MNTPGRTGADAFRLFPAARWRCLEPATADFGEGGKCPISALARKKVGFGVEAHTGMRNPPREWPFLIDERRRRRPATAGGASEPIIAFLKGGLA